MGMTLVQPFQAIVGAPLFSVGVCCDEREIIALELLSPCLEVTPVNDLARESVRQIRAYFDDADFCFDLPLRVSGTFFRRRVWECIAAIPVHENRTYGQLAKELHTAPRAVGQACGANPFPLVIPCHRVIAAGGGLGGFARQGGGFLLDVKRWLLAHEKC